MNWEAVGAVGEAVGAAGVIISLLYLAVQIRGDAREKRAARTHDRSVATRDLLLTLASNPELSEIYSRGVRGLGSLDDTESSRFGALLLHVCRVWEDQFHQWSEGYLDSRVWDELAAAIEDFLSFPGWQAWWQTLSHWFGDQFRGFVDDKVAQSSVANTRAESSA
jgi:hypothetical protein